MDQKHWQGVITDASDRALGTLASVAAELASLFPGLTFEWSPPGTEKLATLKARGVAVPEMVRRVLSDQPAFYCSSAEIERVAVSFNLGSADPVNRFWCTVEGDQQDVDSTLTRLSSQPGWILASEPLTVRQLSSDESPHIPGDATLIHEAPDRADQSFKD